MTQEILLALIGLALAAYLPPGPDNLYVMSLAEKGRRRAIMPSISGLVFGQISLQIWAACLTGAVMFAMPHLNLFLRGVGLLIFIFMAISLWRSLPADRVLFVTEGRYFSETLMLQWISPRQWFTALALFLLYTNEARFLLWFPVAIAICAAVRLIASLAWLLMGRQMQAVCNRAHCSKLARTAPVLLLVATQVPLWLFW
ncbi:hypothetical protein FJU08_00925 [Martelella alba]|uniref:Threonine/homoserine/homoserine lactone efflux protein n=1 Tax=Martelella alba TaxID=2590451 RepID=A0A506UIJ9_9HYPH|nr:hypothetical protein [Martelella alba]TPW33161.1 hypothetical protein FJU08_00925 [Martelella alba]